MYNNDGCMAVLLRGGKEKQRRGTEPRRGMKVVYFVDHGYKK
jgi:hypothetical protein